MVGSRRGGHRETVVEFERRGFCRWGWACILVGVLFLGSAAGDIYAAEQRFLGVVIEPLSGTYEVTTDANVRAGPMTEAKRLIGLPQGTEVEVVGKAKGAWIAIRRNGRDLGFVYEPLLKAVKLPPLDRDAEGRIVDAEGEPIAPASGFYVAASAVNLRTKPSTQASKRGGLKRGMRVEAFGAAENGSWLAVRQDDRELGFVFAEMLLPLIDGTLNAPIKGKTDSGNGKDCEYAIRFSGKNSVEGELFETSDYEIDWTCKINGREISFPGFMFITEAPFQLSNNRVYQISMDLLGVVREYDEVFSTVFLYRRDERKVVFDSVSMKDFAAQPGVNALEAASVAEALSAAANIAPGAWNERVWEMLAQNGT